MKVIYLTECHNLINEVAHMQSIALVSHTLLSLGLQLFFFFIVSIYLLISSLSVKDIHVSWTE